METLEKLFVPYELAKELKAINFNENCIAYYNKKQLFAYYQSTNHPLQGHNIKMSVRLSAPLCQQVVQWFMDEHLIYINVVCKEWLHTFCGTIEHENGYIETIDLHDNIDAWNEAIKKAIEIVKKRK